MKRDQKKKRVEDEYSSDSEENYPWRAPEGNEPPKASPISLIQPIFFQSSNPSPQLKQEREKKRQINMEYFDKNESKPIGAESMVK